MSSLTPEQVALQLESLEGWTLDGCSLNKTFEFSDFAQALAFMVRAGFYCAEFEHYPYWQNNYNIVSVRIGNPDDTAIEGRDIQLAKRIESCLA
ncbi:MAG: 4a-hydroxytetrahydrobiopterin dehydratase [Moraxella sp.]|jgi:putative 4a-hydroxytetrahydrobiopterin dehydratase|nr:MAG: 4a-hydroxytetrahydrobiopterin dehydratase [Moraxella sp.]